MFLISILMAVVQGVTECLPVSSSLHLRFVAHLFGLNNISSEFWLSGFCVLLNFGSLFAILCYYRQDVLSLMKGAVDFVTITKSKDRDLFLNISAASIPTIVVFGCAELFFGGQPFPLYANVIALLSFSFVILYCDKFSAINNGKIPTLRNWMVVGFMQLLSIVPGVSRLGTNLVAFRLLQFDRVDSFRYSMLFAIPPLLGACVIKTYKLCCSHTVFNALALHNLLPAIGITFLSGIVTLQLVNIFIKHHTFSVFALYRIVFAIILFCIIL